MQLSTLQIQVIEAGLDTSVFLSGPAGSGKSTSGVERLKYLTNNGIPGNNILLLFPQRTLSFVYQAAINETSFNARTLPIIATVGGLARRGIELFWPLIADQAGFHNPAHSPTFLTLESSLYFVSQLVTPLITDQGYFSSVTIQRNRLFSQILDNLNKSAVHGFPHTEIADRLTSSWIGDPGQSNIFQDAQNSASLFREYCYQNNLLDYSLQIELYFKFLVDFTPYKEHFYHQYSHLIFDNIEEDVPVAHDFIHAFMQSFASALLIFDDYAGFRSFLGASPASAHELSSICEEHIKFDHSFTTPPCLESFSNILSWAITESNDSPPQPDDYIKRNISVNYQPYYPQLVSWVAERISKLVNDGISIDEIVVLAPYLSDSLRFLLSNELNNYGIMTSSHRPSRALRDEPIVNCLLSLSALAHPSWGIKPTHHDLALTLVQALDGLDLTRANLLVRHAVITSDKCLEFINFEEIDPEIRDRISYFIGSRYQYLVDWIKNYLGLPIIPLDHFLIRLFGELLSQPGYGFHNDISKGMISEQFIASVNKFRLSAGLVLEFSNDVLGSEYYRMVKTGVLANQYPKSWLSKPPNTVYILPAYTFLLSNTSADYQFWLDVGSRGWYERIFQPLTNPHILNRDWNIGLSWTDLDEVSLNQDNLNKIVSGLIRRCKKGLFFCLTETDERGFEQKGLLIQAINKSLNIVSSFE